MSREELFKKYQEIILKTNGGADDYVIALCQISDLIRDYSEEKDQQLAQLKAENENLQQQLKEKDEQLKQANEIINNPNTLIFQQEELIESLNKQIKDLEESYNKTMRYLNKTRSELLNLTKKIVEEIKENSTPYKHNDGEIDFIIDAKILDQIDKEGGGNNGNQTNIN